MHFSKSVVLSVQKLGNQLNFRILTQDILLSNLQNV